MAVCDKLHYHYSQYLTCKNRLNFKENNKMKRLAILLVLALVALFVVACGGGGESSGPEAATLDFTGYDEFRYDPTSATVASGAQVTVNFENAGVLEHNWMLASNTIDPAEASEDDALGGAISGLIPGGATNTFTFTAPPAGTYQILCTVPGHAAAGMRADFIVE
jgi:plastocyanin